MMLSQLKTIHWSALGLGVLAFVFAWAAQQPQLAQFSSLLNVLATFLGTGSLGTMAAAPKVGS
jgi:hypothetical protein